MNLYMGPNQALERIRRVLRDKVCDRWFRNGSDSFALLTASGQETKLSPPTPFCDREAIVERARCGLADIDRDFLHEL
jgi:hypothetical protein